MAFFQRFITHGYKLAFIGSCSTRFGKPGYRRIPQHILVSLHHAVDVWLDIVIFMHRHLLFKLLKMIDTTKAVFFPKFRKLSTVDKGIKDHYLGAFRVQQKIVDGTPAQLQQSFKGRV